ncbi:MAG: ABC transporter permease subunit [Oscillospiraceae bacterium]
MWIIRGSPLMLQILIVFYGPGLLFGWKALPRRQSGRSWPCVAFVINYACYFSEIYRGGIQGVPKGQQEAGQVLGMTKSQIFFKVTLLQVVKRIVPPMGNEFITLVKDTSLVRVISVYEIIWVGESFIKKGMIWPLFYCMAFYFTVQRSRSPWPWGGSSGKLELLQIRRRAKCLFYRSNTLRSISATPGCWRTSALSWSRGRPWPSSAPPAAERRRCCAA